MAEYRGLFIPVDKFKETQSVADRLGSCYLMQFRFHQSWCGIDATNEDGTFGRLINHSKQFANVQPFIHTKNNKPRIFFKATRQIEANEELFYDYNDTSRKTRLTYPWLAN